MMPNSGTATQKIAIIPTRTQGGHCFRMSSI